MAEYIEREALIKAIKVHEMAENDRIETGYNWALDDIEEIVRQMPAADVQSVCHGRWEYIRNVKLSGTIKLCECNQCHNKIFGGLSYCGNCGARMDGDKNG